MPELLQRCLLHCLCRDDSKQWRSTAELLEARAHAHCSCCIEFLLHLSEQPFLAEMAVPGDMRCCTNPGVQPTSVLLQHNTLHAFPAEAGSCPANLILPTERR